MLALWFYQTLYVVLLVIPILILDLCSSSNVLEVQKGKRLYKAPQYPVCIYLHNWERNSK